MIDMMNNNMKPLLDLEHGCCWLLMISLGKKRVRRQKNQGRLYADKSDTTNMYDELDEH